MKKYLSYLLIAATGIGCQSGADNASADGNATELFYNGNIITMAGDAPETAEALVTQDGKIAFVGTLQEAKKAFGNAAQTDLGGKTLLPGFIDPHSHFGMVSNAMGQVDLNPQPVGSVNAIAQLKERLLAYKAENKIADGEWIFGWGYDDGQLTEKRHPTKAEIDAVLPNNPVFIIHTSGHMGVANTLALQQLKITAATPDPDGGHIDRMAGGKEPNGLLQETAMYPMMGTMMEVLSTKKGDFFDKTQEYYAQHGITTAQDGMTDRHTLQFFQAQANAGKLKIDLVALGGFSDLEANLKDSSLNWKQYHNHFKTQGTKIISDGSPQGKTAYFTKPFLTPVPGCHADCRGLPSLSQEALNKLFVTAYQANNQLFIHSNGDASMDMVIQAHEKACTELGQPLDKERRTVVIHSQFVRPDQLQKYVQYKIEPSFFTNHAYFWGDEHVKNLGAERAGFLSPIATADRLKLHYTNHSDATVTPISPMFTVWTAVNRTSRTGAVIGAAEKATPYQALKAITRNAAYQYFEDGSKGTLEKGKLADLVILDKNPLTTPPADIRYIQVVQTIKEGKTIYKQ